MLAARRVSGPSEFMVKTCAHGNCAFLSLHFSELKKKLFPSPTTITSLALSAVFFLLCCWAPWSSARAPTSVVGWMATFSRFFFYQFFYEPRISSHIDDLLKLWAITITLGVVSSHRLNQQLFLIFHLLQNFFHDRLASCALLTFSASRTMSISTEKSAKVEPLKVVAPAKVRETHRWFWRRRKSEKLTERRKNSKKLEVWPHCWVELVIESHWKF